MILSGLIMLFSFLAILSNYYETSQNSKKEQLKDQLMEKMSSALLKVCRRNDIEEAVLDYYIDCAIALEDYQQFKKEIL